LDRFVSEYLSYTVIIVPPKSHAHIHVNSALIRTNCWSLWASEQSRTSLDVGKLCT